MSNENKANKTGKNLERFVEPILQNHGYQQVGAKRKDALLSKPPQVRGKWYARGAYIGQSIYGTKRYCDFLLFDEKFLVIECKWQSAPGSVDEKYPFLLENIKASKIETVVLLDGGGYKQKAFDWLKRMVAEDTYLKDVCTMRDFQDKVNEGFFGQ